MKGSSDAEDKKGYKNKACAFCTREKTDSDFIFKKVPVFTSLPGLLNLLYEFHDRCKQQG